MREEESIDQQPAPIFTTGALNDSALQEQLIDQRTENMEVFHRPDVHHNRKKWKEYLIEFLMIFLAVTLGFFAENLREYISDKGHVGQLVRQLVHDLKNDSAILNYNIEREDALTIKADSLFNLLQRPLTTLDSKELQELIMACYNINLFQPSSGAMAAIKTELHLKAFANSDVTLYISSYESDQALLKTIEQFQEANLKEYLQGFITAHFSPSNAYSSLSNGTIVNGELRNVSSGDLTQLSVEIMFVKNYDALLAGKSGQLKDKATQFIEYVNKEFM